MTVLVASFVVAALAMTVTAVVSRRVGRVSVVDVTWGAGFVLPFVAGWVRVMRAEVK